MQWQCVVIFCRSVSVLIWTPKGRNRGESYIGRMPCSETWWFDLITVQAMAIMIILKKPSTFNIWQLLFLSVRGYVTIHCISEGQYIGHLLKYFIPLSSSISNLMFFSVSDLPLRSCYLPCSYCYQLFIYKIILKILCCERGGPNSISVTPLPTSQHLLQPRISFADCWSL